MFFRSVGSVVKTGPVRSSLRSRIGLWPVSVWIGLDAAVQNFWKCETLNGSLPLKHGSVRPQTLGKRVSDDSPHFIFRCQTFFSDVFFGFFRSQNYRKIENCLFLKSWDFLNATGRSAMKNDPQWKDFQVSTTFGRGVKDYVCIFVSRLLAKNDFHDFAKMLLHYEVTKLRKVKKVFLTSKMIGVKNVWRQKVLKDMRSSRSCR